jgi:hypothetical protein
MRVRDRKAMYATKKRRLASNNSFICRIKDFSDNIRCMPKKVPEQEFDAVLAVVAAHPDGVRGATFSCADTAQRIAASSAIGNRNRSSPSCWSPQLVAATAASHHLVEAIGAPGG